MDESDIKEFGLFAEKHPELDFVITPLGIITVTSGEYRKHHCRSCGRWVGKIKGYKKHRGCVRYERARKNDPACNEWVPRTIEEKEIKKDDNVDLP